MMPGRQRGVTLIELMTVVAVITLLTAVTAPSLRSFSLRNQVTSSQSAFLSTLAFARSQCVYPPPMKTPGKEVS